MRPLRRRAPAPVGDAVDRLVGRLAPRTVLADVQRLWPAVVGATVAAEAQPVAERAGVLEVRCRAAVWAQELELLGPDLVDRLNAAIGRPALTALRCRADLR